MVTQYQPLLIMAIIFIVAGATAWYIGATVLNVPDSVSVAGQVVFWIGIIFLVAWAIIYLYRQLKSGG